MKTQTKKDQRYVYVNITEYTVALFLIADLIGISKYRLFLLYETFGNDLFLLLDIFNKASVLNDLTEYRINKCFLHAERLTPVLLGIPNPYLGSQDTRSYQKLVSYLFENKLRIPVDIEA